MAHPPPPSGIARWLSVIRYRISPSHGPTPALSPTSAVSRHLLDESIQVVGLPTIPDPHPPFRHFHTHRRRPYFRFLLCRSGRVANLRCPAHFRTTRPDIHVRLRGYAAPFLTYFRFPSLGFAFGFAASSLGVRLNLPGAASRITSVFTSLGGPPIPPIRLSLSPGNSMFLIRRGSGGIASHRSNFWWVSGN